jgi:hypothetical protein
MSAPRNLEYLANYNNFYFLNTSEFLALPLIPHYVC